MFWFAVFFNLDLFVCATSVISWGGCIMLFLYVIKCVISDFICLSFVCVGMFVVWFSFMLYLFFIVIIFWVWARPVGRARFRFVHVSFISCFGLVGDMFL